MHERLIDYYKNSEGVVFERMIDYATRWKNANPVEVWRSQDRVHARPPAVTPSGRKSRSHVQHVR
jgi:hypothetical protein